MCGGGRGEGGSWPFPSPLRRRRVLRCPTGEGRACGRAPLRGAGTGRDGAQSPAGLCPLPWVLSSTAVPGRAQWSWHSPPEAELSLFLTTAAAARRGARSPGAGAVPVPPVHLARPQLRGAVLPWQEAGRAARGLRSCPGGLGVLPSFLPVPTPGMPSQMGRRPSFLG